MAGSLVASECPGRGRRPGGPGPRRGLAVDAAGSSPAGRCHPPKPPRGHLGTSGLWPRPHPEVLLPPAGPPPPHLSCPGPALWGPEGRFPSVCSARGDIGEAPADIAAPTDALCLLPPSLRRWCPRKGHIAGASERPEVTGPGDPRLCAVAGEGARGAVVCGMTDAVGRQRWVAGCGCGGGMRTPPPLPGPRAG